MPGARVEILAVRGFATVQDGGRPGLMHAGVPPGGSLVAELAARANLAAGNDPRAALVEIFGGLSLAARVESVRVATDDGAVRLLAPGERFDVLPSRATRARYVAVAGGLDVPVALGGRGTLAVARLGGHEGRALARGDAIGVGPAPRTPAGSARREPLDLSSSVRVLAGPDASRFAPEALEALVTGGFTVLPTSDRVGTRLDGPPLPRADDDDGRSSPMVRGAIQVPRAGRPLVLGPDHPTTGGYPVIAVVARADLGAFFARPIGATVRFRVVSLYEARAAVLG